MVTEMREELLPLDEAAGFLGVSKSTMYRLLDQGKLRGMKAGKQWRFRQEELLAYMQRGPAALALDNLPMSVLDAELDFLAGELQQAEAPLDNEPAPAGEAGKILHLARRFARLLFARRASDLHLEPVWDAGEEYTRVRLRIDGVLLDIRRLPSGLHQAMVAQWKQLANLNPDERTRPQDGSAYLLFPGETTPFPLRVSVVPTIYGEKVAIRAIPTMVPTMAALGIEQTPLAQWMRRNAGLLLVTGPTGSGKLTSALACVRERVAPDINIMALDEPTQYLLPGITQVHVEGFSLVEGLRAILKQDPDIIFLGELSGEEEAEAQLAVQAAENGHLVVACMQANDAIAPLFDLLEWGVKRTPLAANLIGVVNQRLLRKLCPHCKAPVEIIPTVLEVVTVAAASGGYRIPPGAVFYGPAGCAQCHGAGYAGRFPLHEYLELTPRPRAAFTGGAPYDGLRKLALEGGMRTSFAEGVRCAVEGMTSLDEVQRRVPGWQ